MLAGPKETIARARLYRKRLGGGMRQAGVLAAAGLLALEESPARLFEDHENARYLAQRLAEMPGVRIDPGQVRTNIVIFDISGLGVSTQDFSAELKARGVLADGIDQTRMRMVTHVDVDRAACERAAGIVAAIASQGVAEKAAV
jgi:threonine aldolase